VELIGRCDHSGGSQQEKTSRATGTRTNSIRSFQSGLLAAKSGLLGSSFLTKITTLFHTIESFRHLYLTIQHCRHSWCWPSARRWLKPTCSRFFSRFSISQEPVTRGLLSVCASPPVSRDRSRLPTWQPVTSVACPIFFWPHWPERRQSRR